MLFRSLGQTVLVLLFAGFSCAAEDSQPDDASISYYKQIRPIFQAHCQGCHQPAKAGGDYVMTTFERLLHGGESETAAIVPGKPDESYLIELITPDGGEAQMPQGKPPLSEDEMELVRRWIESGAADDTPSNARQRYDMQNPPVYTLPPVITSVHYSPDGQLLAVAGFHEVLLHKADGSGLVARLVGVAERIESVQFSPDGKRLAVTGGLPARMGEVQVWDVAIPDEGIEKLRPSLLLSVPVTFDTIYGGSWSPDGRLIALGCGDNSLRAINAETGEQVLFQGAHTDWVRDTVFSQDGTKLVSVSRDMTVKLTEVATERFIDNITSITPGALKGGVNSVALHPSRDEIVIGGADGVPKVYRLERLTARRIGDDANLIRKMPAISGRLFDVAISNDGNRFAACGSLDGVGEIGIYAYDFDTSLPDDVKKIMAKAVGQRSAAEKQRVAKYQVEGVRRVSKTDLPQAGVFAIDFHPNNKILAAAGGDGLVRLVDVESGSVLSQFDAAPLGEAPAQQVTEDLRPALARSLPAIKPVQHEELTLPAGVAVTRLEVNPTSLEFNRSIDYAQLLVTAHLDSGDQIDVTRAAKYRLSDDQLVAMAASGLARPLHDGESTLHVELGEQVTEIPIRTNGLAAGYTPDYLQDVAPLITRMGCDSGPCHGAAKGKNGFKLSLRGYDALFDIRAFTDDLASRRSNIASPDDSLLLLKATAAVPHEGGLRTDHGSTYYQILRDWIAHGAKLKIDSPKVAQIEVFPLNPVVQREGARQQIRVIATYVDGMKRDVTREAFVESGNTEVADAGITGLLTAKRRGEAPVLVRFEGAYAATTLTVMGDREGFTWQDPVTWGRIDELSAAKWRRMKIQPSELCSDVEFLRRVYLDLTGLPPTSEEVTAFREDDRDTKTKRDEVVDRLVGSDDYVDYWTNKWADLLAVNRKFLGPDGASKYRDWIRKQVQANTPYDEFARQVITAEGSNLENPPASYFKILREPGDIMENTTQLFLAVRFNCNKCHDHPFERWTQDQYYETAAYFARIGLKEDPASKGKRLGGSAVMAATPYYEIVYDKKDGEVLHDRTGAVTKPNLPFDCDYAKDENASRRQQLAAWITSRDNPYFARSYVNRIWAYLLGMGIIDPIDDIRAGNPPSNPELLEYLTQQFLADGFDVQQVMREICKSRNVSVVGGNESVERGRCDQLLACRCAPLPAEVLYDSIMVALGATSRIPGVEPGTRAAALPDSGIDLPGNFLATFGRPVRESACECERSNEMQLGPVMAMVNGPVVAETVGDPENAIAKLVKSEPDDRELINELFLRILNRPVQEVEVQAAIDIMHAMDADHDLLTKALEQREQVWKETLPKLEKKREAEIAEAKKDLEAYNKKIAPQVAEREKGRQDGIKKAEAELKKYQDNLSAAIAEWEKKHASDVEWHLLEPTSMTASNGAQLIRLDDRSIRAEGKADPGIYTINVKTRLRGITGIRLETLPVEGLPGGGPGLPPNGNFVVTEFQVKAGSDPKSLAAVTLQNPKADFTQAGFNIAQVIDAKQRDQLGWAVHPAGGIVHWATFETTEPIGQDDGTVLQFVLHQFHNAADHRLARFRISATTSAQPLALGLPESLRAITATAADKRNDVQKKELLAYFGKIDPGLQASQTAVATAKKPVPIDPGIQQRQRHLKSTEQAIRTDPVLVQLRNDVEQSTQQMANKRLTMAQDLAWGPDKQPGVSVQSLV